MTDDQPLCPRPRCGRPIHDTAYVCARCGDRLADELRTVAKTAGDAQDTIARLARLGGIMGGPARTDEPQDSQGKADCALYPTPLPFEPGVADAVWAAANTLTTWVRHISETRGVPAPVVHRRARACDHASCAAIRRASTRELVGTLAGPVCPPSFPAEHPLAVTARWLAGHLDWLRHRPEAAEAFDDIADASRAYIRVCDRPPDMVVVGQCTCGEYLYAPRRAAEVVCRGCRTVYGVQESRDLLRTNVDAMLFTAAEIATLATYLGVTQGRDRTRNLVNQWARRGHLVEHRVRGEPAYRFGDVLNRLATSVRATA